MRPSVICNHCQHPMGSWWGTWLSVRCRRCGNRRTYDLRSGDRELRCPRKHPTTDGVCGCLVGKVVGGHLESKCRRCRRAFAVPVVRPGQNGLDTAKTPGLPSHPVVVLQEPCSPAVEPTAPRREPFGPGKSASPQS